MARRAVHLLLVRHGKTDWNEQGRLMGRSDVPLNERGRAQAQAAARALAGVPLARVVASPQARTRETALLIAEPRALEVITEPSLAEVWVGARWQGKTYREIGNDPELQRYIADPTYGSADLLEPAMSVRERVAAVADQLRAGDPSEYVAIVSHGDPLRILFAHLLGMALSQFRSLRIDPGSVSVVRLGEPAQLLLLNWQPGGPADLVPSLV
jgi:broad specificity phosphatase PhoE